MHPVLSKINAILIGLILIVVAPTVLFNTWEDLDADQVMVVQSPFTGTLTWHTTPGVKWQGFGSVTKYHRRSQFWFSSSKDQGSEKDCSIKVRFNDGGHAQISGSLSWELPLDEEHLTLIHTRYHSEEALELQLIRTNLEKAVYMTGPLMSSADSYAARRNELLGLIEDQFLRGVYRTSARDERTEDPLTGNFKTVKIVEPVKDSKTQEIIREEESPLIQLAISATNVSINEVTYDNVVEEQIQEQQKAIMAVQTSMAETKTAEQKKLTTVAKGEADAAEAEWKQKVITAQATAEADQKKQVALTEAAQKKEVALTEAAQQLEVAQLATQAAEQQKLAAILIGEGEATARKLVMDADGALSLKLEAFIQVAIAQAAAIGQYTGNWVPSVVMGQSQASATTSTSSATALLDMLAVKTAKDLGLDTAIPTHSGTLPPISRPDMPTYQFVPSATPLPPGHKIPRAPVTPLTQTKPKETTTTNAER